MNRERSDDVHPEDEVESEAARALAAEEARRAFAKEHPDHVSEEENEDEEEIPLAAESDERDEDSREYQIEGTSPSITLSIGEMERFSRRTEKEGKDFVSAGDDAKVRRPRTRGDCVNGVRPCPHVGCRHHLLLEVNPEIGSLKINFPDAVLGEDGLSIMPATCSLDIAEKGGLTLEAVGDLLNITGERVRQIEEAIQQHMRGGLDSRVSHDVLFEQLEVVAARGSNGAATARSRELSELRAEEWGEESRGNGNGASSDPKSDAPKGNPLTIADGDLDFSLGGEFK